MSPGPRGSTRLTMEEPGPGAALGVSPSSPCVVPASDMVPAPWTPGQLGESRGVAGTQTWSRGALLPLVPSLLCLTLPHPSAIRPTQAGVHGRLVVRSRAHGVQPLLSATCFVYGARGQLCSRRKSRLGARATRVAPRCLPWPASGGMGREPIMCLAVQLLSRLPPKNISSAPMSDHNSICSQQPPFLSLDGVGFRHRGRGTLPRSGRSQDRWEPPLLPRLALPLAPGLQPPLRTSPAACVWRIPRAHIRERPPFPCVESQVPCACARV